MLTSECYLCLLSVVSVGRVILVDAFPILQYLSSRVFIFISNSVGHACALCNLLYLPPEKNPQFLVLFVESVLVIEL